jgi:NADH-quinone oxidoreductase subunit G
MKEQQLVSVTIDGIEISVPKGTMILEAAKQAGVLIPHYCYHPGLPIAGVCRMCLVEIEGAPKLQIGCATRVADGQKVLVNESEEAKRARQGVLEFLLIHHPLDCPICDQAGECELQDYVFQEGQSRTRYSPHFAKRFNPVEDFGGDILYVPNRCILCTRCVRFMDHVADDGILNVSERGDRAYIGMHPDRELDHPWSGNVVDLCPVGSLISKEFLHKARACELDKTPSVCTGCSQGCNVNLETRGNQVVRIKPRPNLDVNRYFMCDHGRLTYRAMSRGDRLEAPLVADRGELGAVDWDQALSRAAAAIQGAEGRAVALVSPGCSNEALYLVRRLLSSFEMVGAFSVQRVEGEVPLAGVPGLALREERAPNAAGARALGFDTTYDTAVAAVNGAALVVLLDDALEGRELDMLAGARTVIYVGTTLPDAARTAHIVLPVATAAEEEGTFVNRDGRVQRYFQAKSGPAMARPAWWVLSELLHELEMGDPLTAAEEAFEQLAADEPAFTGLSYATIGLRGARARKGQAAGAER